jgi:hypothetical protein
LVEVDDWISAREAPRNVEESVSAGVGLYIYVRNASEDEALEKSLEGDDDVDELENP